MSEEADAYVERLKIVNGYSLSLMHHICLLLVMTLLELK